MLGITKSSQEWKHKCVSVCLQLPGDLSGPTGQSTAVVNFIQV